MSVSSPSREPAVTFRRLDPHDEVELRALLGRHPAHHAHLLGQVARGALADPQLAGPLIGWWEAHRLVAVACIGSNLVLSHLAPPAALAAFAGYARESGLAIRVVSGPEPAVALFMDAFGRDELLLERDGQILFEVVRARLPREARSVELRPAQPGELEALIECDLAMVREELGFDPFSAELAAYRRGWQRRLQEWRTWVVGPLGGPIVFKVDQASVADEVVQLAGVYTRPEHRGQGLARRAVGEMCHLLLRDAPRVCLQVHAPNTPAVRLYRGLGFCEVGRVSSAWLAP